MPTTPNNNDIDSNNKSLVQNDSNPETMTDDHALFHNMGVKIRVNEDKDSANTDNKSKKKKKIADAVYYYIPEITFFDASTVADKVEANSSSETTEILGTTPDELANEPVFDNDIVFGGVDIYPNGSDGMDNSDTTDLKRKINHPLYLPYPYVYNSDFVMRCLADQVARAKPEPAIAVATSNPETIEEDEIPYVTPDSVLPPLDDEKTKDKTSKPVYDVAQDTPSYGADKDDNIVAYDRLLRNSTPAGINQNAEREAIHQQIASNLSSSTAPSEPDKKLLPHPSMKAMQLATKNNDNLTTDKQNPTDKKNSVTPNKTDTTNKENENGSDSQGDLQKEKRLKNDEEARAEKEAKLESYKQFVAEQESKVEIDYPSIRVSIEANALPSRMYFTMNALAAIIASYGLVMNSAAVVIGAMLVAMMLGPISGSALAIIDYRMPFLRKSILTVLAGATMVWFIGYVIGSIHIGRPLTNEILSRTQPTSMDLMVALAGGIAGAYAMISPHLSVAVVGVAVATALVPPLAASGILFANGEITLGFGALLLAVTNIIAIQFTNGLVLWFAGFRRLVGKDYAKNTNLAFFRRNAVPLILLTGIGVYLSYNLSTIASRQAFENDVTEFVSDYFLEQDNMLGSTQFVKAADHETLRAVVSGQTRPSSSDVRYLESALATLMAEDYEDLLPLHLQIRYMPVVVIESTPRPEVGFGRTDAAILSAE